jgi:myosin heavy subunit
MDNNPDNLKLLIENLKTIGFWGRLFSWKKIRTQLVDASADLQKLISNTENLKTEVSKLESAINDVTKDLQLKSESVIRKEAEIERLSFSGNDLTTKVSNLNVELSAAKENIKGQEGQVNKLTSDNLLLDEKNNELNSENKRLTEASGISSQSIADLTKRKAELDIELAEIKKDLQNNQTELGEVKKQNTQLNKDEEFRKQEHSNSLASLEKIRNQIQADRIKEIEERNAKEVERIRNLKNTWSQHQENTKNTIKSICQKHTIQYLDQVSFKGDPDNTLLICDEYIVFDAKSPGSDDLSNFPNYLKDQAEKAKKYAKQESVKSDIFLVVPSNSLDHLTTFVYRHGEHNAYIISVDALEPIILGLKKIEEYEFAEQLSPEDRENICRVLGRFAHLSKRRIQVDSFFAKQFIELAFKCETDLPKDILDSVIEFEKAQKLNPPQEKRVKSIPIGELDKENKKIMQEAEGRGIIIEDESISNSLNELPLYKKPEG